MDRKRARGHYLILGGARSGKSIFGERIALGLSSNPAYIATAQTYDPEMVARVKSHQQNRDTNFVTIEEPLALSDAIKRATVQHDVILVDCLTLWLSNIGFDEKTDKFRAMEDLLQTLQYVKKAQIILVSNEVGMGIVPDNALAREFRDDAGLLHQKLAQICDHVIMVAAGLPLAFKGEIPNF